MYGLIKSNAENEESLCFYDIIKLLLCYAAGQKAGRRIDTLR
jgi:hypothetical protein